MKLSTAIDLEPHRAAACQRIDRAFPVDLLRQAKAIEARRVLDGASAHPSLIDEASVRGCDLATLCRAIVAEDDAARAALLTIEAKRQAAKAAVQNAGDHHAILAAFAASEGPF